MFYFFYLQDFVAARNQVALDVGFGKTTPPNSSCASCNKSITQVVCVAAPRLGNKLWHPNCFKCTTCDDLLVDLVYCVYEEEIYCERHYAEKMRPRCAGCDEVNLFFSFENLVNAPGNITRIFKT